MSETVEEIADVMKLISDIKHGLTLNSLDKALKTEELLKSVITKGKWNTAQELLNLVKIKAKKVQEMLPRDAIPTNIMRHFLKIVREEYEGVSKRKAEDQSLLDTAKPEDILDYSKNLSNLKSGLLEQLAEYRVELEASTENIANQALEHIHANEIILTVGKSSTVEKFLISASKHRTFEVIVVESPKIQEGHQMALNLANKNIKTTLIPDASVFAMMSRVNKVVIGTYSVLANGGLRAISGMHGVALAAEHYSVPVVVIAHLYKFTPVHVGYQDQETFNELGSPADVLPYNFGALLNKVTVYNPLYDYVPPELIALIISHQGGNSPSYVYRILSEQYHKEDYEI